MRALSSSPPPCRRRREEAHSLSLQRPFDGRSQSLVTSSPTDGKASSLAQSLGIHATSIDLRGRYGLKSAILANHVGMRAPDRALHPETPDLPLQKKSAGEKSPALAFNQLNTPA